MSDQSDASGDPAQSNTPHGGAEDLARRAAAGLHRTEDGQVDVLRTVGGVRGLVEAIVPGVVFLGVFTATQALNPSLVAAVAVAAVFSVARLAQRTPLTQALAGLAGVVVCAFVARTTGEAKDYYVPGFYTNAAYGAAMLLSIAVRWPFMGLVFGFVRGEGTHWRGDRRRQRAYAVATWVIVAVFALRLAVQLPLYFADQVQALGAARLVMGLPLYAMGLWLAWLISRHVAGTAKEPQGD
jgi:hypothetical protein